MNFFILGVTQFGEDGFLFELISQVDKLGNTALHVACNEQRQAEILTILLNCSPQQREKLIDMKNNEGQPPKFKKDILERVEMLDYLFKVRKHLSSESKDLSSSASLEAFFEMKNISKLKEEVNNFLNPLFNKNGGLNLKLSNEESFNQNLKNLYQKAKALCILPEIVSYRLGRV